MARTRSQIHQNIYMRLNEQYPDSIGAIVSYTAATEFQSSTATFDYLIDLGIAELTRTVYLVPGKAVFTAAISQREVPYQSMTGTMDLSNGTADGSYPWWLDQVSYNGTALTRATRNAIDRNTLGAFQVSTAATPTHFYRDGQSHVGLYPLPSFTAAIVGYGYLIPPSITAQTAVTWASDDMASLLELYAAIKVAEKQYQDDSLYGRLPHLVGQYNSTRMSQFLKIAPSVRVSLGLVPPIPYGAGQSSAATPQPGSDGSDGGAS
jgi:hypothetical protein